MRCRASDGWLITCIRLAGLLGVYLAGYLLARFCDWLTILLGRNMRLTRYGGGWLFCGIYGIWLAGYLLSRYWVGYLIATHLAGYVAGRLSWLSGWLNGWLSLRLANYIGG